MKLPALKPLLLSRRRDAAPRRGAALYFAKEVAGLPLKLTRSFTAPRVFSFFAPPIAALRADCFAIERF